MYNFRGKPQNPKSYHPGFREKPTSAQSCPRGERFDFYKRNYIEVSRRSMYNYKLQEPGPVRARVQARPGPGPGSRPGPGPGPGPARARARVQAKVRATNKSDKQIIG